MAEHGTAQLQDAFAIVAGEPRPAIAPEAAHAFARFASGEESAPIFPLRGADLVARGVPKGPRVGEILARAREAWLELGCPQEATPESLICNLPALRYRRRDRDSPCGVAARSQHVAQRPNTRRVARASPPGARASGPRNSGRPQHGIESEAGGSWAPRDFRLPRDQARRQPANGSPLSQSGLFDRVETWRVLDDGRIEFTMRRLPSAD